MKETGEPKKTFPKRFYLRWPWNVIVYIVLAVVLRVFAIPLILLIMWWNKKQQPDGPEEGCCLRRTRGRLTGLIPATLLMAGGALCLYFFYLGQTLPGEVERLDDQMRVVYHLCPFLGAGMILIGIFLAYRSLRDALYPEKSALAQSIRDQLPYPDEAPPVKELFAMVDRDLTENGAWFGKLGVGREWVLGDVVSRIPRIRGVFSRVERQTHHAGKRTTVTYIYELWIVDDCQRRQVTSLKSKQELEEAMDCLRRRVPAALFGAYDSKEYQDLVCVKEDMQQYTQERAYRKRAAQAEERNRKEQEGLAQNQVLTLPDGSVTSRITPEDLRRLLLRPSRTGEAGPFQLVPGVPLPGGGTHLQPPGLPLRRGPGAGAHSAGGIFRNPRSAGPVRLDPGRLHRRGGDGAAELAAGRGPIPGRLDAHGANRPRLAASGWGGQRNHLRSTPAPPGLALVPEYRRGPAVQPRVAGHRIRAAGADPGGEQLPDPGAGGARKSGALLVYPVRHGPTRPGSGPLFCGDRSLLPCPPTVGADGARCAGGC